MSAGASIDFYRRKVFRDDQLLVRKVQRYGEMKRHVRHGQDVLAEREPSER